MPKPLPPDDSSHDAALAAWEAGQGASAPDHANPAYQALRTAFLQHPDVVALDTAIATAQAEPSAIEVHTLHLPSGLTGLPRAISADFRCGPTHRRMNPPKYEAARTGSTRMMPYAR